MFYDLNLPADGVGDLTRREVVAMAMQLGYSGVAANHVVTGVMGETDRCRIRPIDLQIILAAAPGVAESALFHQKVLGVPQGQPFRQFSRITVIVETLLQANAVNSANPVLKSYDLVAVRPTNQKMFSLACSQLEVDLISLDFTQRLPVRLQPNLVKAAVERGIYFEICYGQALLDPKARRELFINSKKLQEGARGRNIVVCSGARRVMEMRGPNDVANMSTLFGFSLELAKNSVSRTCKSLLLHGVARKSYKAAIHVERVSSQSKPTSETFDVPMEWDPLSLGGSSVDFIPVNDTDNKSLPIKRSIALVEEVKLAFSERDGRDNATLRSVYNLAVAETVSPGQDTSGPNMVTSKSITSVSAKKRRRGKKLVDSTEDSEGKNKASAERKIKGLEGQGYKNQVKETNASTSRRL